MDHQFFISNVIMLFVIYNALGQIPVFLAILSPYEHKRQRAIILRESLIALGVLLLFDLFGKNVLNAIGVSQSVFGIAGGLLLFLIAMTLIFPKAEKPSEGLPRHEPMIVPLAIPGLAGPGAISTIIVASNNLGTLGAAGALVLAWIPSTIILFAASYLKKFLGEKGLHAIERLGGMLICLLGAQMIANGTTLYVKENFFPPEQEKISQVIKPAVDEVSAQKG
jgi:multiple antibiotic resistance protein